MEGRIHVKDKVFGAVLFTILGISTLVNVGCAGFSYSNATPPPATYGISGTIGPSASGSAVTVTLSGATSAKTTTDSSGNYSFSSLASGNYTVTPSKSQFSFSPSSQSKTITSDVTGVNFTASQVGSGPTYSISGTISPTANGAGVTMILGGAASASTTTDSSGNYTFSGLASGSYTLTPSKSGYSFSPGSQSETISTANVSGVNFTASQNATISYSISGTISPTASGAGVTMTLGGAASASSTTDSSGNYTFSGLASGSYTLTPSKSGYTFSPASQSETISTANATGVNFTASQNLGSPIPASFWGLIINKDSYPLQVPYGEFRGWDAGGAQWPNLEICKAATGNPDDPCFDWTTNFDPQMADLFAAGVNDVFYTMSRTPQWGVDLASDPTGLNGTDCNYYQAGSSALDEAPGQCLLPVDLNADGSGTDQMWKNWITAIAAHVNDPVYLQTHAHIKYWEPWNEWFRGSIILPNYVTDNGQVPPTGVSYAGTYAQMVRLTEDMRCVITGKGTIHNFPSAGNSTPCSATPIDANALIVSPDGAASTPGPINVTQNFLYCNGTGSAAPASGSFCTTGNAGSQAVDIINFHLPAGTATPETVVNTYIPNARAMLQAADQSKPMINGEGSWNIPSSPGNLWSDPYAQAGFVPRFFALYWSAGLTLNMWYSYDTNDGGLFFPSTGKLNEPAATSWTLTYKTLVGATPINTPFCSNNGTVYTCDFMEANGSVAELIWDAQYGQNCSQMTNPVICGSTNYSVPIQFNKDWVDVTGIVHSSAATVTIGANPILLEGQ
jgi:hypothetical protein